MRNPNASRDFYHPVAKSRATLENSVSVLEDPKNNRKLILVGSMNASDLLAHRTAKLLQQYKPDSVLVQTSNDWFDYVNKMVSNVESNEDIFKVTQ